MLSPQTIKKIKASREGNELIRFMAAEVASLDRTSDIPDEWDDARKGAEVTARKRAAEKLAKILEPLLEDVSPMDPPDEKEPDLYYNHLVTSNEEK